MNKEGNLCWNCGRLGRCGKKFFCGDRPVDHSDCVEWVELRDKQRRFTRKEIAHVLGRSVRYVSMLLAAPNGAVRLVERLRQKGISLTYELGEKQIHFYREVNQNDND